MTRLRDGRADLSWGKVPTSAWRPRPVGSRLWSTLSRCFRSTRQRGWHAPSAGRCATEVSSETSEGRLGLWTLCRRNWVPLTARQIPSLKLAQESSSPTPGRLLCNGSVDIPLSRSFVRRTTAGACPLSACPFRIHRCNRTASGVCPPTPSRRSSLTPKRWHPTPGPCR